MQVHLSLTRLAPELVPPSMIFCELNASSAEWSMVYKSVGLSSQEGMEKLLPIYTRRSHR